MQIMSTYSNVLFAGDVKLLTSEGALMKLVDRILLLTFQTAYIFKDFTNDVKFKSLAISQKLQDFSSVLTPQTTINIENRRIQIITESDPLFQSYIKELNLIHIGKNTSALCLLINENSEQMQVLGSEDIQGARKLYTALLKYQHVNRYLSLLKQYSKKNQIKITVNEALCTNLIEGQGNSFVIDPYNFGDSQNDQIQIICTILQQLKEIQKMKLKFKIVDQKSIYYAVKFLQASANKTQQIEMCNCQLVSINLLKVLEFDIFTNLQSLNLSKNFLKDNCFAILEKLFLRRSSATLKKIDLSQNQIQWDIINKDSIIAFFEAVQIQIMLDVSNNKISSPEFIMVYVIYTENIPLNYLSIANNKISVGDATEMIRLHAKLKHQWKLDVGYICLDNEDNFKFLQRNDPSNNLTIQVQRLDSNRPISKTVTENQTPSQNKQQLQGKIQKLHKAYSYGDFKAINLLQTQFEEKGMQIQKLVTENQRIQKKFEESLFLEECNQILNFQINQQKIIYKLQDVLKKAHRKGIEGQAVQILSYLKYLIDKQIFELDQQKYNPLNEIYSLCIANYGKYLELSKQNKKSFYHLVDYWDFVKKKQQQLILAYLQLNKRIKESGLHPQQIQNYDRHVYITLKDLQGLINLDIIKLCKLQLKLVSARLLHNLHDNSVKSCLVKKRFSAKFLLQNTLPIKIQNKLIFLTLHQIRSYPMNFEAKQKQSLQGYQGLLIALQKNDPTLQTLQMFTKEVIINFLKFLYYSPQQVLPETIQYLQFIVNQIQQSENYQNLCEQFYLHLLTYDVTTKMKQGLLKSLFQYLSLSIPNSKQIQPYIISHLLKHQITPIQDIRINFNNNKKIDWVYTRDMLLQVVANQGLIKLQIITNVNYGKSIWITVHHITNIGELLTKIKFKLQSEKQQDQTINVNFINLQDYWLFGREHSGKRDRMLSQYQVVGKIISENLKLVLKKVFYDGRLRNKKYLSKMRIQQLQPLFWEVRNNYLKQFIDLQSYFLQSSLIQCSCSIIIIEALIKQVKEQQLSQFTEQIQNFLPPNIQVSSTAKLQIPLKAKQSYKYSKQQKQDLLRKNIVELIWNSKQIGCCASINYQRNAIQSINLRIDFFEIVIYVLIKKNGKNKLQNHQVIHWSNLIDAQYSISKENLFLYFISDDETVEKYAVGTSEQRKSQEQIEFMLNAYLLICGYARKRLQCDYQTLYYGEHLGSCNVDEGKSQEEKYYSGSSILRKMKQFVLQPLQPQGRYTLNKKNNRSSLRESMTQLRSLKDSNLRSSNNPQSNILQKQQEIPIITNKKINKPQQIEDIIKKVNQQKQQDDVIVNKRRSGNRRSLPRRQSRDRQR